MQPRQRKCRNCRQPVISDRYGELEHEESGLYQCEDGETIAE